METRTYKVYKYDELTEEQKEKVLNNYADILVDDSYWHEHITEKDGDAERIGLDITEWDLYRRTINGHLTVSLEECIDLILKEHGETCDTYALAKEYRDIIKDASEEEKESERYEKVEQDFTYALLQEYLSILDKEYEYNTSREAIEEHIRANDYSFTEDGKID